MYELQLRLGWYRLSSLAHGQHRRHIYMCYVSVCGFMMHVTGVSLCTMPEIHNHN
jgi:hypothetical protein